MDYLSIVVGVVAIIISVTFFFYAQKSANDADKAIARIQIVVEYIDRNTEKLVGTALNAIMKNSEQDASLLRSLLTRNEAISNEVAEHFLEKMDNVDRGLQGREGYNVMKEEIVEITKKELNETVNKALEHVLESQRDNILSALTILEGNMKDNSLQKIQKELIKEEIWQLRQNLDNVKARLKEITNHT